MPSNLLVIFTFRMDFHTSELVKVCRVCGKRVSKAKGKERSNVCMKYRKELAEVFSIDVSSDCEDIHPLQFCQSCRVAIGNWYTRGGISPSVGRVFQWTKHAESECRVSINLPQ